MTWEPDARHAEHIIRDLGLQGSSGVVTPGIKDCDKPNRVKTVKRYEDGKKHSKATQTDAGECAHIDSVSCGEDHRLGRLRSSREDGDEWLRQWRGEEHQQRMMVRRDTKAVLSVEVANERAQVLQADGWSRTDAG